MPSGQKRSHIPQPSFASVKRPCSAGVKQDPDIEQKSDIKQEPSEEETSLTQYDSKALSHDEMISRLGQMYDGPIDVCDVTERHLYSSCCEEPLIPNEPILTSYRRGEGAIANYSGPPTCFTIAVDKNGDETVEKKRSALFIHPHTDTCRNYMKGAEYWMVYPDQKVRSGVPRIRKPCAACESVTFVRGVRETTQITFGHDNETVVLCKDDSCLRTWQNERLERLGDTKGGIRTGEVTRRSATAPVHLRVELREMLDEFYVRYPEESMGDAVQDMSEASGTKKTVYM
jgi:hypothetical protein